MIPPKSPPELSGDLGAALAAEARAARPAFDPALHERLMASLPKSVPGVSPFAASASRVRFPFARVAALAALITGSGALALALKGRVDPQAIASLDRAVPSQPAVAEHPIDARTARALLNLAHANPAKLFEHLAPLSPKPRPVPPSVDVRAQTPGAEPGPTSIALTDNVSIRLLSRSPFVSMSLGRAQPPVER